jgi:hypothetical protein
MGDLVQGGKDAVDVASERVGVLGANATEVAKAGYDNVSGRVGTLLQDGKEAVGIAGERAGVVGNNAAEAAKNANDFASKEAGHLLGNAQEMLGGKIEDLGKGIKPDE